MSSSETPTKGYIIHGQLTPLQNRLKQKKGVTNSTIKLSGLMLNQKSYINPRKSKNESIKNVKRQEEIDKAVRAKQSVIQMLKFGGKRQTKKLRRKRGKNTRKH